MEHIFSKKNIIIAGVFLILLALGVELFLSRLDKTSDNKASGENSHQAPDAGNSGAGNRVVDPDAEKMALDTVFYSDIGFSPKEIIVAIGKGLGCVVNVENTTRHSLTLGVSPHNPVKDPGQNYLPVKPGEHILFDPRYSGFTELSFHDHERPELSFTVKFAASCQ